MPACILGSPAFAESYGLPTVEECGCPPKPWRRRTGASAGYAVPQVPRLLPVGLHYSCYFNKAIISSFIENMDYSKDRISTLTDKIKSSIENVKG
jgi:hypothetical protein